MKQDKTSFAALLSISLVGTVSTNVSAEPNPFALKELGRNPTDLVAEAAGEAKAQAGNAAGMMKGAGEMKCGANMMKGSGMMNQDGMMTPQKGSADASGTEKPADKGTEPGKPSGSH